MPVLQKNQTITLEIDGYTAEGAGVGHFEGMAVFVPGTLMGETVQCHIIKCAKRYAVGKLRNILASSPRRTTPPCPDFGRCGGCALQHMNPTEQLAFKQQRIADAFSRIGGLSIVSLPVFGMANPMRYRNKAAFPVGREATSTQIGLYAARSHRIIPVEDCLLQSPTTKKILSIIRRYMEEFHISAYHEPTHSGLIRHVVIRHNELGQFLVCLVSVKPLPHVDKLAAMLQAEPGYCGLVENINPDKTNVIFGAVEHLLDGQSTLPITLCGLKFEVSVRSFFQVNLSQAERLYQCALSRAMLTGQETVVDAYCGVGSMSLLFAQQARRVIGIECVAPAVANAKHNASINGLENASFICDYAEKALPRLCREGLAPDVLLLDPPRKGCDRAVLDAAIQSGVPRIVYVSCDPATQARDAAILAEAGYRISDVQGVDMFCQTPHVETVCHFMR